MNHTPYPKIELHVHLEATVRPQRLLAIARRNDVRLPARDVAGLERICRFRGFAEFIEVWIATTAALRRARDFREITVEYAAELARQGCRYAEAVFSPAEPVSRGVPWREVFEGYCDGAQEAREAYGVELRFTPDITRAFAPEVGEQVAAWALAYRERGVVGIGLGGDELRYPPASFSRAFAIAREGGLKAAPHAGETAGPESIRSALDDLHADRLRHGVRAVDDAALLAELAQRGIVCDVTPVSNLRTGVVRTLGEHPLPALLAAGVKCSVSSDDPALMQTSLQENCAAAIRLGHTARAMYEHALAGAFCDARTRARLLDAADAYDWAAASATTM